MAAPLYNTDILRLAAQIPHHARLTHPDATVELRSPTCGSRVAVDVRMDHTGHVAALGLLVQACALGQASASLMAAHAMGRSVETLEQAAQAMGDFLGSETAPADFWPGIEILAPARDYPARHASIRLAFDAVAQAARAALRRDAA